MKLSQRILPLLIPTLVMIVLSPVSAETVPLKLEGGTFVVPVVVNNQITLNFTIDSGAADVSIPEDVFSTLTRTGTIARSDYQGVQQYQLADGSPVLSQRVRIRSLKVGSVEVRNVIASVAPLAATLLLGQSFLARLPSWSIDNQRHVLVINQSPSDVSRGNSPEAQAERGHVQHAQPPDWLKIGTYTDGKGTVYVDTSSVTITNTVRRAWVQVIYAPQTQRGVSDATKWVSSVVMRQAVNCEQETIRLDEFTFYFEDGSTDRPPAATLPTKWEPVSPVGAAEKEMQVICGVGTQSAD